MHIIRTASLLSLLWHSYRWYRYIACGIRRTLCFLKLLPTLSGIDELQCVCRNG